ncbi:uncharacterized protein VNE69_01344 [Vairimorpha necatrix]|uniref:Uncharacterized protein n=1 Tax=Vairimorpha necatrix TaxID=6039 RepID=A0AAX4J945_9MICR
MLSFKEKIDLVKKLKREKLDLSEIDKYLEYLKNKSLVKPVFKKIIISLIELDVEISSLYDTISDEDWNDIISEFETPIEKPLYGLIRDKIRIFISAYIKIDQIIENINCNLLLDCLSLIPLSKTNTVQFLFFRLALQKSRPVLYFLFENVKSNPIVYIPYFTSFVTRCKINNKNAILQFIKYVEELKIGTGLNFVLAAQGLIYICCFHREYIEKCSHIFDKIFKNNIYIYMNENIIEIFCSITKYEYKFFKSFDNFSLFYFPFDKSLFDQVHELYSEKYREFKK